MSFAFPLPRSCAAQQNFKPMRDKSQIAPEAAQREAPGKAMVRWTTVPRASSAVLHHTKLSIQSHDCEDIKAAD